MTGFAIICTLPLVNGATIPPSPGITPTPILRVGDRLETLSYDRERRDLSGIISSITAIPAAVTSYLGALPSDVANGILPAYTGLPTADDIKAKYNLTDEQIDAEPLQVLNVPGYANWTSNGWQLRMHGTAYKQPPLSDSQIDDAAKPFLPNLNTSSLNSSELAESRNLTASLLVIPQSGVTLDFLLTFGEDEGDVANFTLSGQTDAIGEFNEWVGLGSLSGKNVPDGQGGLNTTVVNVVSGQDANSELIGVVCAAGNATAYFPSTEGVTIVADIDDILRITQIYSPEDGLDNSFAYAYRPWMNMPEIFQNWSISVPNIHFHYLTTTPEQVTRAYESFVYSEYPLGSFDVRPENFTTIDQTLSIRKVTLFQILETFPNRSFVLIADTSNPDVMQDYPLARATFGSQVSCILLRNTSATDDKDHFPYDTSGFEGIDNSTYMFFRTPDDLKDIDIANGGCRNTSFAQNVTFEYQGLPSNLSGLTNAAGHSSFAPWTFGGWGLVVAGVTVMILSGV
ncbi:uncharacterized protein STEHIDRAFT_57917 [Stereum hirsutum FP-91666 SS1]|uniref:uncharacterized protein n=1 Tax=Stereum hirsutum (strain FP-91666) TaxID=721885 RepID=UPI000440CF77|nr:uncharacterized protein STEHIDRAFT_57917 [Stereum hirsutum FP-91666 SS1]EIM86547.1 hypothetical protein STEHIDRAFT_57917 [Stereum hirsutum FP-91666 SS1]